MMLGFQAPYSQTFGDSSYTFFFTLPTDPKSGKAFEAKRKKRGCPAKLLQTVLQQEQHEKMRLSRVFLIETHSRDDFSL